LRSARLQGLLEIGPARLLAAMLGDLGVSTLRSTKTMTQCSSLFGASNQPCCLLQCSGTTLRVRLRCPLVFLHRTDLLRNLFLITLLLDLLFLLFWTIIPTVGVLDRQTYQGGTRGSRLCGGDHDQETDNSKVCTRTRDTRFIQVRTAKVASPTSCLGDQVWRPALGVGLRLGAWLGTQPSFI
jgi:hypothetical protein